MPVSSLSPACSRQFFRLALALLLVFPLLAVASSPAGKSIRVQEPGLPDASMTPDTAGSEVAGEEVEMALEAQLQAFVGAEGFSLVDLNSDFWEAFYSTARFPALADWNSVFMPDAAMGPIAHALLLLEAKEGALPRVRYHIEYRRSGLPELEDWRQRAEVKVTRYNLGPALHQETRAAYGPENTAPAASFGLGPHLRWRLVIEPIQGRQALVVAASRRILSETEALGNDCLGQPCLSTHSAWGPEHGWLAMQAAADPPTATSSSVVAEAAQAMSETLLGPDGYGDPADSTHRDQPQLVLLISHGVDGSDPPTVAVAHVPNAMDDALAEFWIRRIQFGEHIDWEQLPVYRPGRN